MFCSIDMKVEKCFQLVSNVECFKAIHTVRMSDYMLSCDVSFLPSHYSDWQLVRWVIAMLATAVTVHTIAGNVEVDYVVN